MTCNPSRQRVPCAIPGLVVLALATMCLRQPVCGQSIPRVELLSVGTDGNSGNHHSGTDGVDPPGNRISADGRFVVFESNAVLVCNDNDASTSDIVMRDRWTGRTALASAAWDGSEANNNSFQSVISADGRHVAFASGATNLVPGGGNGFIHIFHHDLQTGTTGRASVSSTGELANSVSYGAAISADGRYVAFHSGGSNLVPDDNNGTHDVFVRDVIAGTTERVSVTTEGQEGLCCGGTHPSISADGRYVAFLSQDRLDPEFFNNGQEVFLRDRQAGTTKLVSLSSRGGPSNGVRFAALSADGRFVAFQSGSDSVVIPDQNGSHHDIFLRDLEAGMTTLVSVATDGTQGNRDSWMPSISADGRSVAFHSWANNLVPGDTNTLPYYDVFVRDTVLRTTTRVNVTPTGGEADKSSQSASISADGSLVYFESTATNLAQDLVNGFQDVFLAGPAFPGAAAGASFELEPLPLGVPESGGRATITVTRMGPLCNTATVRYATTDGAGTASAGADYAPASGTLTFLPGVASLAFEIAVLDDTLDEPDESIQIALANPTGGPVLGDPSAVTLAILDDDAPGPAILSVTPARVPSTGGVELVFEGSGFRAGMVPRLGGIPLLAPETLDGETLRGFAPELAPGRILDAQVADAQGNILAVLPRAVEVVEPEEVPASRLLGPQQVEGSLAEGRARFIWSNPVTARQILVKDEAGGLLQTLSGTTNFLEMAVGQRDEARVYLESVFGDDSRSDLIEAKAQRSECDWPPPLTGADQEGEQELAIYGMGTEGEVVRCGPSVNLVVDIGELGLKEVRTFDPDLFRPAPRLAAGGGALFSPRAGTLITDQTAFRFRQLEAIYPGISELYTRRLITGFTLNQDADKLRIEAFYSMPVYEFGVQLRGRLVHVHPNDGFADEFTFPEFDAGTDKRWHGITYYRATKDVIDPTAEACWPKQVIPVGDYRLELFAVKGDAESPHFVFATDGRNEEILITGVPCPPYPRVRVFDLTGRKTLPVITEIMGQEIATGGEPMVEFTAIGTWTDEAGRSHSIRPGDPTHVEHDFKFLWTVRTSPRPQPHEEQGNNTALVKVPRIGCYRVDLRVSDPACAPPDVDPDVEEKSPTRSVLHSQEVPVKPIHVACNAQPFHSFLNPMPDPSTIYGVAGLKDLERMGRLPERIEPITVYVVPPGCCDGSLNCDPPDPEELLFRLTALSGWKDGSNPDLDIPQDRIINLCKGVQRGPRYFQVVLHLDELPLLAGEDAREFRGVQLKAKTTAGGDDTWRNVGLPMRMTNRPDSLAHSRWVGTYEKATGAYRFVVESARNGAHRFNEIADTNEKQIFEGVAGAVLPKFPSSVNAGLNFGFTMVNGEPWKPDTALSTLAGKVIGNQIDTSPITAQGKQLLDQLPEDLPVWEWSERKKILEKEVQQKLFQSVLFAGVIVVIPVTIWGSISLALDFEMEAFASGKISPFAPLRDDPHFFQSVLGVSSKLGVSLPAELRADILFGIVSHTLSLETSADSRFSVGLETYDTDMHPCLQLSSHLDVSLGLKLCMLWFYCLPKFELPLLDHPLIDYSFAPGGRTLCRDLAGSGGGSSGGSGGGVNDLVIRELLSGAATAVSPDRDTVLDFYFRESDGGLVGESSTWDGKSVLRKGIRWGFGFPHMGPLDMAASFVDDERAIVLLTTSYPEESGIPVAIPLDHTPTREELNELKAQDEVLMGLLVSGPEGWEAHSPRRLCDPTDEVLPPDRRADGRPSLAGSARHGDAIAAWVRIEDREYLIEEPGSTTVYEPAIQGGETVLVSRDVPTVRPRLEKAAIYTRRVSFDGLLDAPRKISTGGINVEPSIAFSPSGNEAWCVWVNDSVNTDLIASNRGRNLLCSVWRRGADSWSAPRPVLADPDGTPGVLEPSLALKGDGTGILAFNALERGAPPQDTGLGGAGRFVYTCRLAGGVFGPPVLVHGLCGKRVVGRYQTLSLPADAAPFDPRQEIFKNPPDWVMTFQGTGALGSKESSGEVLVSVLGKGMESFTSPVSLTSDGRTHANVLGTVFNGGLHSINLKGGLARAVAGGGGPVLDSGHEILDHPLDPDLVLVSCKLSDQFPGAGARVKATVTVENRGLAGSAVDRNGASLCGVRILYTRLDGTETVEAEGPLPVLEPGAAHVLEFQVEMPLDPVRLRAEVFPNPGDRDPTNDAAACFFGAPSPGDLACRTFRVLGEGGQDLSVAVTWTNPIGYDEVGVYRDGSMAASLPGGSTSFVEHGVSEGEHLYEVRGRVGASRSARMKLTCRATPPPPRESFRRGDADGSGDLDISDAIRVLGFLFLGGAGPACHDAADADDNGSLEITDGIRILGFLFLGAARPPAPGPAECGADPTADELPPCAAICS